MIVADTNVVSELMRPKPMQAVVEWTSSIGKTGVGITVVTVTEIEYGLARLPAGRRQRDLAARWRGVLRAYADKLLDYQTEDAQATASILAERDRAGRPIGLADAQIAGICRVGGFRLATRDLADFAGLGLDLMNPFDFPSGGGVRQD